MKVWSYVAEFQQEHGYSPSLAEIMLAVGLTSKRGVTLQLDKLESMKIIKRDKNVRRSISVLVSPDALNANIASDMIKVPVLGEVIAGNPVFAEQNYEGYASVTLSEVKGHKDAFLLKIKGNSMNKAGFTPGDYAVVVAQEVADSGDIVIAFEPEQEVATIKRLKKVDGYVLLLPESTDPNYQPIVGSNFVIQGRVINKIEQRTARIEDCD